MELTLSKMEEINVGGNFSMKINDDIMFITVVPDIFVELEMVQEVIKVQREILQGNPILVVLDVSKASGITKEAREYTSGEHVEGLQVAMAIVVSTLPMKLLANFFIRFDKPPAPTKMFNSINAAIDWLDTYR